MVMNHSGNGKSEVGMKFRNKGIFNSIGASFIFYKTNKYIIKSK